MLTLTNTSFLDMALDLIRKKNFHSLLVDLVKIIFGANMSPSVDVDNAKKDILFLGEGPTPELHDTTMTIEKSIELISLSLERNFV